MITSVSQQRAPRFCQVIRAGRVSYRAAWAWQQRQAAARSAGQCGDTLLLLEHPPTITLGRAADRRHVLAAPDELARHGVEVVESDRGGDVTYHAPGQLVGYPILKLSQYGGGVLGYLRALEAVVIRVLATYGIVAGSVNGLTGVWVDTAQATGGHATGAYDAKIAAIGVRLSASGVTTHGFALNIAPDLRGFAHIVPCGIQGRQVTSLERLLGTAPPRREVAARVIAAFGEVFQVEVQEEEAWQSLSH